MRTSRRPSGNSRRQAINSSAVTGKKRIWSKKRSSQGLPASKAPRLRDRCSTPGSCARTVDSRPAPPCRRCTGRRRRCRRHWAASRCAPDCTWSSPADGADRAAWPPARRDRRRPGPAPDSWRRRRCRGPPRSLSSPLMRRMNSMLSGHQGASSRTELAVFAAIGLAHGRVVPATAAGARCATGSRSRRGGRRRSSASRSASSSVARGSVRPSIMDLQRADARRDVDDARQGQASISASISAWTRRRSSRSSASGPYSTSR